jgi:type I restriction enzyme S subunit
MADYTNLKDQRAMSITAPTIDIQEKIAAILSAYDDLIENNKRRIALLEKMVEEIYREWFVRMRFPGYKTAKFNKGVPNGWKKVSLEKAITFTGGGTPSKKNGNYWADGNVNWFTPSDITSSRGIFLDCSGERCNEEGLSKSSARLFPAYSIMMTSRATIGAVGINTTPACTNQGFITCMPNERYPLEFLYHWLKLSKPHFELLSGGATFPELTKTTFKRIEILTPPNELVFFFADSVAPTLKAIEKLLHANVNLENTRDMLLPRLILGRLLVEELRIQFPPSMQNEQSVIHA